VLLNFEKVWLLWFEKRRSGRSRKRSRRRRRRSRRRRRKPA
jgi:hypothetical protein